MLSDYNYDPEPPKDWVRTHAEWAARQPPAVPANILDNALTAWSETWHRQWADAESECRVILNDWLRS